MFQVSAPAGSFTMLMGAIAVFTAAINCAGGFVVTQRMLGMFKKEPSKGKHASAVTYGRLE